MVKQTVMNALDFHIRLFTGMEELGNKADDQRKRMGIHQATSLL